MWILQSQILKNQFVHMVVGSSVVINSMQSIKVCTALLCGYKIYITRYYDYFILYTQFPLTPMGNVSPKNISIQIYSPITLRVYLINLFIVPISIPMIFNVSQTNCVMQYFIQCYFSIARDLFLNPFCSFSAYALRARSVR